MGSFNLSFKIVFRKLRNPPELLLQCGGGERGCPAACKKSVRKPIIYIWAQFLHPPIPIMHHSCFGLLSQSWPSVRGQTQCPIQPPPVGLGAAQGGIGEKPVLSGGASSTTGAFVELHWLVPRVSSVGRVGEMVEENFLGPGLSSLKEPGEDRTSHPMD